MIAVAEKIEMGSETIVSDFQQMSDNSPGKQCTATSILLCVLRCRILPAAAASVDRNCW